MTALHVAADHGNTEIMEVLVKANAEVISSLLTKIEDLSKKVIEFEKKNLFHS